MSDHSEMKQYIEQRLARGLDTPELDGAEVLALINELERVKALNHQQFGDAIRKNAEVEALKGLVNTAQKAAQLSSKQSTRYQVKLEIVRLLLGSSVPSDEELNIAIDAAMRDGEKP